MRIDNPTSGDASGRSPYNRGRMSQAQTVVTVHADRGDAMAPLLNPLAPLRTVWRSRELLGQLARREVVGRYRGSYLGVLWALLTPLMTLAVFTLVFGAMQHNRWEGAQHSAMLDYPMNLFIGIILFGMFSEVTNRASGLITNNPNFVKKAVFPLELLGISTVIAAAVHALMTLAIEVAVVWIALGYVPWTALLLPVVFVPSILVTLGICWALAAVGVFFRDLGNVVGPVVQLMFFLTPIVYPLKVLDSYPAAGRALRLANPFVIIVENARMMLIGGQMPDWRGLGYVTALSAVVAMAGYVLFMKVRRYFADAM